MDRTFYDVSQNVSVEVGWLHDAVTPQGDLHESQSIASSFIQLKFSTVVLVNVRGIVWSQTAAEKTERRNF